MESQQQFFKALEPLLENLERFALNLTRNRDTARDLVGETVLSACENYANIRHEKALLSYLFTTASRIYFTQTQKSRRTTHIEPYGVDQLFGGGIAPDDALEVQMLYTAMDKIEERQREALILSEIMGFKLIEIAEIQHTSLANVKVRIHRAKKALAGLLGADNRKTKVPVTLLQSI